MVLVQRLTLLAANLADGEEVIKEEKKEKEKASSIISPTGDTNSHHDHDHRQQNGHSKKVPAGVALTPIRRQFAIT